MAKNKLNLLFFPLRPIIHLAQGVIILKMRNRILIYHPL